MNLNLSVKNVSKSFGLKQAVSNVSFDIKTGEIFSLIGPNGSGKTTIIKMIAGLLKPINGEIFVSGFNVEKNPEESKSNLGYIPDEPSVWPSMAGEEFLHFVGALYNMPEKERNSKILHFLSEFKLRGLESESFEEYSRGNKQKFSIVAALIHEPKLLLIDEPIVGLDPQSAEIAKKHFKLFAKNGGSVLMVTHTLDVAEEISDRVGLLENGKLLASGSIDELRSMVPLGSSKTLEDIYMAFTN